jgi:hypothetical protein
VIASARTSARGRRRRDAPADAGLAAAPGERLGDFTTVGIGIERDRAAGWVTELFVAQ